MLTFGLFRGVLIKLVLFSISLAIVPISSYFLSEKYIWAGKYFVLFPIHPSSTLSVAGNSNYAAITAVCAANIVLFGYIGLSVLEDSQSLKENEDKKLSESRKER
ncbi:hypothetical protein BV22DRAFT_1073351 [Leucogyrophana mollusca]|uniref:Uncharacterized protein n=1 Tax=Leucogyrophana mollusca TaxID=85980 RepID=A0ACB8B5U4_9AGAM|nr:hypothetical protein BV22DRAFT_1073351 [Leucogyrophana mollusca]